MNFKQTRKSNDNCLTSFMIVLVSKQPVDPAREQLRCIKILLTDLRNLVS